MPAFTTRPVPLYFAAWKPRSTLQYVLTILFLLVLAIVRRALQAYNKHGATCFRQHKYALIPSMDKDGDNNVTSVGPGHWRFVLVTSALTVLESAMGYLLCEPSKSVHLASLRALVHNALVFDDFF